MNNWTDIRDRMSNDWDWTRHFISRIWDNAVVFITNGQHSNELALTIITLFILLLTNLTLLGIMLYRRPRLFLDKGLVLREMFFAILFALTLYAFYTHHSVDLYLRISLYLGLALSGLFVIIGIVRESTMDEEDVVRLQKEEKRELEGWL